MSQSTLTVTLNYSGQPNVTSTLTTADYPDAVNAVQNIVKSGGIWINSTVGGVNNQFIPATAILFVTVS